MSEINLHTVATQAAVNTKTLEQVVKNQDRLFQLNQTSVEVQNSIKLTLERVESDNKFYKSEIVGIKKDLTAHEKESIPRISKFSSICTQVKIQWIVVWSLVASTLGCAFFIIRTGLLKG